MTVIVGFLPTPEGRAALDAAMAEARRRAARLLIVNASRGDALVDKNIPSKDELAQIESRLQASGISYALHQESHVDDLVDTLLGLVEDPYDDLIVIGLRPRSPVGKLFLGSNSQRILLGSPAPVLAVKASGGVH